MPHILRDLAQQATSPSQASFHTGIFLHNILYGVELYLYLETMRIFLVRRRTHWRRDILFAAFSTVMLMLVTIFVVINGVSGQEQISLPTPQEQVAHFENSATYATINVSATVFTIMQEMADGLMIYRCRILWNSKRIIIFPLVLWLISLTLGILAIWSAGIAKASVYTGTAHIFGLVFYPISVFLQTFLTSMICYRLVSHAKQLSESVGKEFATPYFNTIRLLVESVLPLTVTGIAFLVSYGVGSTAEISFGFVYTLMMCVSPQLLILRVAEGNAWEEESVKSSVRFGRDATRTTVEGSLTPDIALQSFPRSNISHLDSIEENKA